MALSDGDASALQLGARLVANGSLSRDQLREALHLRRAWEADLADVLYSEGLASGLAIWQAVAEEAGSSFINCLHTPPDQSLLDINDLAQYRKLNAVPWREIKGHIVMAARQPSAEIAAWAKQRFNKPVVVFHTAPYDLNWVWTRLINEAPPPAPATAPRLLGRTAVLGLLAALALWWWHQPQVVEPALWALSICVMLGYFGAQLLAGLRGAFQIEDDLVLPYEAAELPPRDCPVYTVLVPLMGQAAGLCELVQHLRFLRYPHDKLDIKLLIDARDRACLTAVKEMGLPRMFHIVALDNLSWGHWAATVNAALPLVRGEFVTVCRLDDRPDAYQLRNMVIAFRRAPKRVACLHSRPVLSARNTSPLAYAWLLDRRYRFEQLASGLTRIGVELPSLSGGVHLRTKALRAIRGFDPVNTCPDFDLRLRLHRRGYVSGLINAETHITGPGHAAGWLHDRRNQLKGGVQSLATLLAHPKCLLRYGLPNTALLALFTLGRLLAALAFPPLVVWWLGQVLTATTETPLNLPALMVGGTVTALGALLPALALLNRDLRADLPVGAALRARYSAAMLHVLAAYLCVWQWLGLPMRPIDRVVRATQNKTMPPAAEASEAPAHDAPAGAAS